jgi:hypothetical protein
MQSNPLNPSKPFEMYAEIAPGLGETLASGAVRGAPYRVLVNKDTGEWRILSLCSYSVKLVPLSSAPLASSEGGGTPLGGSLQSSVAGVEPKTGMQPVVVDYTEVHTSRCIQR